MPQRWKWTEQKRAAFMLLQKGRSQAQVAAELGMTRRTIEGWARRGPWRKLQAERDAELKRQLAAENAAWHEDFARRRAEEKRLVEEHLADFERQLKANTKRDYARYRAPSATPKR